MQSKGAWPLLPQLPAFQCHIGPGSQVAKRTDEETGTKDPVQASAEELGKSTATTTFKEFGLSLISGSLMKSRAIAFVNRSRPEPQQS